MNHTAVRQLLEGHAVTVTPELVDDILNLCVSMLLSVQAYYDEMDEIYANAQQELESVKKLLHETEDALLAAAIKYADALILAQDANRLEREAYEQAIIDKNITGEIQ